MGKTSIIPTGRVFGENPAFRASPRPCRPNCRRQQRNPRFSVAKTGRPARSAPDLRANALNGGRETGRRGQNSCRSTVLTSRRSNAASRRLGTFIPPAAVSTTLDCCKPSEPAAPASYTTAVERRAKRLDDWPRACICFTINSEAFLCPQI